MRFNHGQYYAVYRDPAPDPVSGEKKVVWHPLGKNERVARVRLNDIETLLEQGRSPRLTNITFADAWKKRVAVASVSDSTRPKTRNLYDTHFDKYFGSRQVRTLCSKQVINEFTEHVRKKGMKDGTLRVVLTELKAFLNWCYASEYLPVEPRKDWFEIPRGHARNQKPLKYEQVEALAAVHQRLLHRAFVIWSAFVGTRLGESRAVRWEDLSDGWTEVWVRRAWAGKTLNDYTKTGDTRHTPIMPRVREVLRQLHEAQGCPTEGWVFTEDGEKPMDADNFRQRYYSEAKATVGLGTYTIHDLRHTCCSLMHKAGATPREIMEWLGWKNMQTLLRYLHNYDEDHDIADWMQQRWSEAMTHDAEEGADDASDGWSCCL